MPKVRVNGIELDYSDHGSGDETVVFSHSYLVDRSHFAAQIAALSEHYRVIAYDHRDHGMSGKSPSPYPFETLVEDAVGLIRATHAAPCHFIGLSTGGFVGTRLLVHHPELLRSAVLMDTSGAAEPLYPRTKYNIMLALVRVIGVQPLMPIVMGLMFASSTHDDPARAEELATWRARIAANDPAALIRFGHAIFSRDDILDALAKVDVPVMVVVGAEDRAQPVARARQLAAAIPNARLEIIPKGGHLCTLDQPEAVSAVLLDFLRAR